MSNLTTVNSSCITPVDYKVLIKQEVVETKSKGGIITSAGDLAKKEQWAETKGRLIAVGGNAFEENKGVVPKVGDMIIFKRYAGESVQGADGEEYKLCMDRDICAVIGNAIREVEEEIKPEVKVESGVRKNVL